MIVAKSDHVRRGGKSRKTDGEKLERGPTRRRVQQKLVMCVNPGPALTFIVPILDCVTCEVAIQQWDLVGRREENGLGWEVGKGCEWAMKERFYRRRGRFSVPGNYQRINGDSDEQFRRRNFRRKKCKKLISKFLGKILLMSRTKSKTNKELIRFSFLCRGSRRVCASNPVNVPPCR